MAVFMRLVGLMFFVTSMATGLVLANAQNPPGPHTVTGQVINSVTGDPIARARVQVGNQAAVLTDHEGSFSFEYNDGDSVFPLVTKPGYFTDDPAPLSSSEPVTLRLDPEAIIFGTVTDPDGEPIQSLKVELSALQAANGFERWQVAQTTSTNAEGQYRFAELRAGKYRVTTGYQVEGLPDAPSSVALIPVTLPPASGDGGNMAFTISAGQQTEANATPSAQPLYPVSGEIHGMTGGGAGITVESLNGEQIDVPVRLFPGGVFRLRMPSGTFRVRLQAADAEQQLFASREISVGAAPLEGITMTLNPAITLPIETEYQSVNSDAQRQAALPYVNASLESTDFMGPLRVVGASTLSTRIQFPPGPEGSGPMVFRGLEPGHYRLQVQPQSSWYAAAASCGNVDLIRETLTIGTSAPPCTVHITYRDDAASLKWSATPAAQAGAVNPGAQVSVCLIPLDNLSHTLIERTHFTSHPPSPTSPAEGSFEEIVPGRYLVLALSHRRELPYRDPEALQKWMQLGQEITLTRGGKSEVQLTIVTGEP